MTDKQIIIDGVDVSECPYYCGHDICKNTCHYFSTPCEWVDVQNCIYKQLKRAEKTVEECHKYQAGLEDKIKAKEQECEELKKETVNLKLNLKKVINLSQKKNRQCYQFLADIKQLKHQHESDKGLITSTGKMNYQLLQEYDKLKAENKILKEKFEIAIKNNMDKTLLRLEKGDVQEELQEIREQFGIETLYCHIDNTRVHRCLDVLRLKDTLTEIKEIAERCGKRIPLFEIDEIAEDLKQILQKISECEVK